MSNGSGLNLTGTVLLLMLLMFACEPQTLGENVRAVVDAYNSPQPAEEETP